ncbi:MAG: hypothetical protein AAB497_03150 [Patescibacteria group bacterium]|mgnify:CR=1 FL=1
MRTVKKLKKLFPISLAILLGVAVIIVAIKGGSIFGMDVSFTSPKETDNSWKSALSIIPGDKSFARVERGTVKTENPSLSATSTTGIISQKILLEYAAIQKRTGNTEISDSDAQAIVASLVQNVDLPQKIVYKLSDLNISKDNSTLAGGTYKESLTALINKMIDENNKDLARGEDALSVVTMASETQNSSILEKLNPIITRHQTLIKNLLALETPSSIAGPHLHLLQSYEDLRVAMIGLQKLITDPIIGLTAITEYQNGIGALFTTVEEYNKFNPANQ